MNSTQLTRDSQALLVSRRDAVETAMARYLAADHERPDADERAAARRLFDMLLAALDEREHAGGDPLAGRFVDRFGDGLAPVLRDVFGLDLSDAVIAICVDRYWARLRARAA